ncbi:hypothetical protein BSL78_05161 [Apostichopus japonicus]|uniref:Tyrosine-protein kinase ephrin type A/B receptor-like domain-containing protein n=1 Tax=Stichopus japonicus TaxID=307972 RepID=A0A2G8LCJ8_STIJA|nr:hypothetical protein BSL78_05161 [Apostichopus japonicus]
MSHSKYLTCENLYQIPWSKNKLFGFCVRNAFVPVVTFKAKFYELISFFQKQGFMCQNVGKNEKCRPCAPGRFADGNGMCRQCPRGGFYQDEIGSQECKHCSNGNFVKDGGGFSALDCTTCPDGTNHSRHAGFRACFCKRIIRIDRFGLCTLCLQKCLNSHLLLDPIIRFKFAVIFPIGIIVVPAWVYLICKVYLQCCKKTANAENQVKLDKIKSKLLNYVVLILFITYQPTCDAIFEIYPGACDTFVVDREGNITISLLRADYDINCRSIAHYQTEAYIATVLYVIAYPLILLIFLRKYCRKLTEKKVLKEINNDVCCSNSLSANEITPLLSGYQSTCRTIPTCLKFLTENYKEQFWFWEILELGRKVGQTILITLLGWEDALTKLFTIGTSVLFLSLHVKFSPMKSPFEQHLQLFSLIAIFLNILVAAVPVAVQYQATLSTLLILLDVGIVLAVAGEVLLVLIRFVRRKVTKDD